MPELAADAPALDAIGDRLQAPWMAAWLVDPKSVRADTRMPRLLTGPNAAQEAADIAAYLGALRAQAAPASAAAETSAIPSQAIADGSKLFTNLGCAACHILPGETTLTNDARVILSHTAAKWHPGALAEFLRAPTARFLWSRMPDFKLATNEAVALSAFVLDRVRSTAGRQPPATAPFNRADALPRAGSMAGDEQRGAVLTASLGCLNCHTLNHATNRATAPALAALATADWTRGCVADQPDDRGKAPDLALDAPHRSALRAFARDGFPAALHRDAPAEFAERQYVSLRCSACHPRDNETDLLTALAATAPSPNQPDADDESGSSSTSVHIGRPLLSFAGEKLYAGWMRRLFNGTLPYKPRPELQGRMPAFPAAAPGLAEGLAHQHGYPAESAPTPRVEPFLAAIGKQLTQVGTGFSCVSCHNVGDQKALAGKDTATVNFACVAERLRATYYWRYVQDPPRLVPSTMMPKFIGDDGTTPIKSVFDGNPQQQFTAVWHYLMSLRAPAPAPPDTQPRP
jgi:cytochrome c2